MSKPEVDLWVRLRRNEDGFHFRRQHPIGPYVADFYCAKAKLIIEVDSYAHSTEDRGQRDEARDAYFLELGIETMRLDAADIYKDADEVALGVWAYVRDKLSQRT
jgi:very-short-patch-repair endonuclease